MFLKGASPHNLASVGGRCPARRQWRRVLATPCSHPPAPWGVPDPSETDIVAPEPSFVGGCRSVRVLGGGRRLELLLGGGRRLALLLGCGRHSALLLGCGRHSAPPLGCGRRVGPFGLATFFDNTAVVGFIRDGQESEYRRLLDNFVDWCTSNYLLLTVMKTKEMVVDFSKTLIEHNHNHHWRGVCGGECHLQCRGPRAGISARDASRINKLICNAGSIIGHKLEAFESVRNRRSLNKLLSTMDIPSHPLYNTLQSQQSS
ncbi:hypothetical protein QTP86_017265 [Hemibagrus guttatus]|nr:hypothetical protein QTP86_017265 [Hemibagrus guttatus]